MLLSKLLFQALFLSLFLAGCAPEPSDHESQLTLDLTPLMQTLGTRGSSTNPSEISRVMATVSGPGIAVPISFEWERSCAQTYCNFPGTVNFNVPTGSQRLIQVMAVAEDNSTQTMSIFYGFQNKDLINSYETVDLNLTNIASGATGGQVIGRYINADGTGPTGKLLALYTPTQTGVPMRLYSEEIFDGWFRLFLLQDTSFSFKVLQKTGTEIAFFGGEAINLPRILELGGSSTLRVHFPIFYQLSGSGNGTTFSFFNKDTRGNEDWVMGFFGSNSGKTVTYPASNFDLPYYSLTSTGSACSLSNLRNCYYLNGSFKSYTEGATPTAVALQWNHTSNTAQLSRTIGGTDSTCSSSNEFVSCFNFRPMQLRNGPEAAVGFNAPFSYVVSDESKGKGNYLQTSTHSSGVVFNWKFLPGIVSHGAIDGIGLFTKKFDTGDARAQARAMIENPYFSCQQLVPNFQFTEYTIAATSTATTIPNSAISSSDYCKYVVVACPYVENGGAKLYFSSHVDTELSSLSNCYNIDTSTSSSNVASKIGVVDLDTVPNQSLTSIYRGKCKQVKMSLLNSSDAEVINSSTPITLLLTGTMKYFDSDAYCLSSATSNGTLQILTGTSSRTLYLRQGAGTFPAYINVSASGPSLTSFTSSMSVSKLDFENINGKVIAALSADNQMISTSTTATTGSIFLLKTNNSPVNFSAVKVTGIGTGPQSITIQYKTFAMSDYNTPTNAGSGVTIQHTHCVNLDANVAAGTSSCDSTSDISLVSTPFPYTLNVNLGGATGVFY